MLRSLWPSKFHWALPFKILHESVALFTYRCDLKYMYIFPGLNLAMTSQLAFIVADCIVTYYGLLPDPDVSYTVFYFKMQCAKQSLIIKYLQDKLRIRARPVTLQFV